VRGKTRKKKPKRKPTVKKRKSRGAILTKRLQKDSRVPKSREGRGDRSSVKGLTTKNRNENLAIWCVGGGKEAEAFGGRETENKKKKS